MAWLFEGSGEWSLTQSNQHVGRAKPVVAKTAKYVPVAKSIGMTGVLLPPGWEVWGVQSEGRDNLAWVAFFMDDATTVKIQMCDT